MTNHLFSVVIPIIPKHFRYLSKLLFELESESNLINEILICASSVSKSDVNILEEIVENSRISSNVRIVSSSDARTAGENRNMGWDEARGEFIAFLDADDTYHSSRLTLISKIINDSNIDALVHDYYRLAPRRVLVRRPNPLFNLVDQTKLRSANKGRLESEFPSDDIYSGQTNLKLPNEFEHVSRIHHGHLIVRRSIPIRYSPRKLGEDGELVVEILKNGYNLSFIDAKLSIYDRLNFSNIRQSFLGHTKVISSRIYRFLRGVKK